MYNRFGLLLQKKLIEATEKLEKNGNEVIGTEGMLLALINLENSVCHYVFQTKMISLEDTERKIIESLYIRNNSDKYTAKFLDTIELAERIASADKSDLIYDEHLLYALLVTKDTIACNIMEKMGINIDETLIEVKAIFDFDKEEDYEYLVNITKEVEKNKHNPFIGRKKYVDKIIRILSKKQKNNPMLIGNAGVGKSALVEGVAQELINQKANVFIYRLEIGAVIAGTKYRGDLESRIIEVIDKIKGSNNILFIDEIHNIISSDYGENNIDIANILKPILARNEIKCIGATTLDEYYKYIAKDKALLRRFQNIFIEEPQQEETLSILKGIAPSYEKFHNVKYSTEILKMIINNGRLIKNRYFPDIAIDILDEAGLAAKNNNRSSVNKEDVKRIVFEYMGLDYQNIKKNIFKNLYFPILRKYYYYFLISLENRKTIVNIKTNDRNLKFLLKDITDTLSVTKEMILELDFSLFTSEHYSSTLIGSPSGYVGYEDGGQLTEHVSKYPIPIIIIRNFSAAHPLVINQVKNILKNGWVSDGKGRIIKFNSSIFIFIGEKSKNASVGFINNEKIKEDNYIDEELNDKLIDKENKYYREKLLDYLTVLKENDYFITLDIEEVSYCDYLKILKLIENMIVNNFDKNSNNYYIIERKNNEIYIKNKCKIII